ncbi:MAG: hypothetical protein PHI34_09110 [Acidobacteriota bacterium]|nr:hypothetical protein [Acidobacteriota bacterium]
MVKKLIVFTFVLFSVLTASQAATQKKIGFRLEIDAGFNFYSRSENNLAAKQMLINLFNSHEDAEWSWEGLPIGAKALLTVDRYFEGGIFLNWTGIASPLLALGGWHAFHYESPGYYLWNYYGGYWWGYEVPPYRSDDYNYSFTFPSLTYGAIGRFLLPIGGKESGPLGIINLFGEVRYGETKLAGAHYSLTIGSTTVFRDNYSGKAPYLGLGVGIKGDILLLGVIWNKALIQEVTATTMDNIYNPDAVGQTGILNTFDGKPLKIDNGGFTFYLGSSIRF